MKTTFKKLAIVLALSSAIIAPNSALAYELINTTATYTLSQGTGSQNVILKFGATINETLTWVVGGGPGADGAFSFSDDVIVTEDLDVDGVITAGSSGIAITDATGNLDGEQIAADTIDDDSIDFSVGDGVSAVDIPLADTGENFTTDDVESALAQLAGAVGATVSLDAAYNSGNTIDVDGSAVTLTVSDTDNNAALALVQNDVTNNNNAFEITNAGTGNSVNLAGAGSRSINSSEGNLTIKTTTSGDLNLTSAAKITGTVADNTASAFLVQEGENAYITIDTTNDSELITFGKNILVSGANILRFRDTALTINSSGDGQLDIDADTELEITAPIVDIDASTSVNISNDLKLDSDAAVLGFGADNDVTLTHVADTGLLLNSAMALQFRDAALSIGSSGDGQLDIDADTEVEITTTTLDLNGALDVSGTINGVTLSTTALDFQGNATIGTNDDTLALESSAWDIAADGTTSGLTVPWADIATRSNKIQLVPEIAGAVYRADGGDNVGELTADYDAAARHNYYKWTSAEAGLQDYDVTIAVMVPSDFTAWDGSAPIKVAYKTTTTGVADNQIDVTMVDTAGVAATLGATAANMVSAEADTWTSADVTITDGTWTAGSYAYLTLKPQAKSSNAAYIGEITLTYTGK
ncbi:MAG: hypothetical protein PHU71_03005 [Candidatus Gracilibacteria bacterium]|nr:hypothetical protein [Candidatus Gracilibacteria bacterium]